VYFFSVYAPQFPLSFGSTAFVANFGGSEHLTMEVLKASCVMKTTFTTVFISIKNCDDGRAGSN
jgi:hypothetical protein